MQIFKVSTFLLLASLQAQAKWAVHEWGTFTSLVGSDGVAQNGMSGEDEALPDFVHSFGDSSQKPQAHLFAHLPPGPPTPPAPAPRPGCPRISKVPCEFLTGQQITQKMETPVVYFHSDEEREVRFEVGFPGGIISQSYPAATLSSPEAVPGVELRNGFARYDVRILKKDAPVPPVSPANIYSHARNAKSDLVQVGSETEKFIFYRGLGAFHTRLQVRSQQGSLDLENRDNSVLPAAFLLATDGTGRGRLVALGELQPGSRRHLTARQLQSLQTHLQPESLFLPKARALLGKALVQSGLFADEARAMLDTWEHGYFKTPGLRILYVLSPAEVAALLPARLQPAPDQFSRAFVGRIEILLDTQENQILKSILSEKENYQTSALGRLAYPTLLRVREVAREQGLLTPELAQVFDHLVSLAP